MNAKIACSVLHARNRAGSYAIQLTAARELVGVGSYLLIGFFYEKPSAAKAGMKAFVVNRIGDVGFAFGPIAGLLLLLFTVFK